MPADSSSRRFLKALLAPVLNERTYRILQAVAKAWDIRTGSWSEPELRLLPYAVRPGETVIDIGANYGVYAYHLSRLVGRSGRVHAFEPIPFTCQTCRIVGRFLGWRNVELIAKGCSERGGRVLFTIPVQESGAISGGLAHLAGRNDQRDGKAVYSPYEKTREVWCDVVALDDELPDPPNLSFIKSDIEGADLLALRGAARLIERHHPTVQTEIKTWFLEGFGIRPEGFTEFFGPKGYRMYHFETAGEAPKLRSVSIERLGSFSTDNYLFIHPSRLDRFAALLDAGDVQPDSLAVVPSPR